MRPIICQVQPFVCSDKTCRKPYICWNVPFVGGDKNSGFTLVEFMVVVAIVAVLTMIGYPNFRTLMQNQRLGTLANDFIADLSFARSEAVKRVGQVGLCVSTDGATCTGGNWEAGRVIFVDLNNSGGWDNNDLVLRVREALHSTNTFRPGAPLAGDTVLISSRGTLATGGVITFAICDGRGKAYGKGVAINALGQARVEAGPLASCN
jgi:type IV fimbrial biogenesis protein FimT